jgi:hypothetical protein
MQCYQHQDRSAVGLCKACHKGVCAECVTDTGQGLACSEKCVGEVGVLAEIVDRSKQIYGIGSNSRMPSTGILFYAFFAIMCLGFGLYPMTQGRDVEMFLVVLGAGFLVFGAVAYIRTRKLRLNC